MTYKDPHKLRDLGDLLLELEAAEMDGYSSENNSRAQTPLNTPDGSTSKLGPELESDTPKRAVYRRLKIISENSLDSALSDASKASDGKEDEEEEEEEDDDDEGDDDDDDDDDDEDDDDDDDDDDDEEDDDDDDYDDDDDGIKEHWREGETKRTCTQQFVTRIEYNVLNCSTIRTVQSLVS